MPVYYLQNPDIVLRDEDDEGGLLINPKSNGAKLVNTTGLFIWKQFATANTPAAVAVVLQQEFADVPAEQVVQDIQEFVAEMISAGFLLSVDTFFPT
jgi:hypothetical protein